VRRSPDASRAKPAGISLAAGGQEAELALLEHQDALRHS
jgi:hypothetical protein